MTQKSFRELHAIGNPFILANAWDIGSAKVLASLGAQAIATTSSGHAFTLGRVDMGGVSRDEALSHAQDLVRAVNIPVSGDFENGFGDSPDDVAKTIGLAHEVGLSGCSIEDTQLPSFTPYEFDLAVERIKAGASKARSLNKDFILVARADGVMNGQYGIDEAIRRIQAFDAAGADCVYVPMPETIEDMQRVIQATSKPVNVLASGRFSSLTKAQFAQMGAARISIGGALARIAQSAMINTAQKMLNDGNFSDFLKNFSEDDINQYLK